MAEKDAFNSDVTFVSAPKTFLSMRFFGLKTNLRRVYILPIYSEHLGLTLKSSKMSYETCRAHVDLPITS
jgi:hypothetical protein